jgi:RNA polymerase sigma-70 factor (ECF subfamily)
MMTGVDELDVARTAEPLSDMEVVRRVRSGETALFEILMRRHNQRLYRVARAIVKEDSEAEDVMQEAYVNAYTHLHQFAERAQFSTWLTRIAVHEALARVRRRARLTDLDEDGASGEQTMAGFSSIGRNPEQQASNAELRTLLEATIESLPQAYRVVFVLREIEGLSTAETADCLSVTEETVKTRLHRGRALLREELFQRAGIATSYAFEFHLSRCDRLVKAVLDRIAALPPDQATPGTGLAL